MFCETFPVERRINRGLKMKNKWVWALFLVLLVINIGLSLFVTVNELGKYKVKKGNDMEIKKDYKNRITLVFENKFVYVIEFDVEQMQKATTLEEFLSAEVVTFDGTKKSSMTIKSLMDNTSF